ncbi:Protein of unknown function precursor [Flavobacterium indicum GPTSA100-9 = DSM 17447]|uniref:DUF6265 domain-containing protein n=1 Tax=Flavobacterium indicum (strain DSM 17447 / CIP 109464 / GPTSA100-9) TaxID=1094466 RepID=H8XRQ5_FLAIG|nr:DUF6265 family protein [Flavobacterium indicum]CCG54489.1 Protein of unknown function precursor [Flavobacterium indicum GPTSA100-9 = DSM 17447]
MKNLFSILTLFIFGSIFSQNTLHYNDEKGSPKATLQDIQWFQGIWKGQDGNTFSEEIWSAPGGKTMHFSFKMWNENEVIFYEIGHVVEKDKSLELQIKHFDKDLKGWEKQEESENFKLVKIDKNRIYFDKITYEKISDQEMNVYVYDEESKRELQFNLKK